MRDQHRLFKPFPHDQTEASIVVSVPICAELIFPTDRHGRGTAQNKVMLTWPTALYLRSTFKTRNTSF